MILARLGGHGARDPDLAVASCVLNNMVRGPTTQATIEPDWWLWHIQHYNRTLRHTHHSSGQFGTVASVKLCIHWPSSLTQVWVFREGIKMSPLNLWVIGAAMHTAIHIYRLKCSGPRLESSLSFVKRKFAASCLAPSDGRPVRSQQANQLEEERGGLPRADWALGLPWGGQVTFISHLDMVQWMEEPSFKIYCKTLAPPIIKLHQFLLGLGAENVQPCHFFAPLAPFENCFDSIHFSSSNASNIIIVGMGTLHSALGQLCLVEQPSPD